MRKNNVALMVRPALLTIAAAGKSLPQAGPASPGSPVTTEGSNLPFQPIGASDLIRLGVSASPGFSQVFRVDLQGNLNLLLLRSPISAEGLMPNVLGDEIAAELRAQHLLVNPIVVVSVVEHAGRGVTVAGAVKTPTTIQDLGNLRVLTALVHTGGLLGVSPTSLSVHNGFGATWDHFTFMWDTDQIHVRLSQQNNPAVPTPASLSVESRSLYLEEVAKRKAAPDPLD